ncbi:N-6 DNA methylase [Roseivirga seohaensis]|uniref:N-6 DNA methylase n=1 Tax=Roseivirga seohaensis TaxID=1914963 RepID=UPI00069F0182|nr:N-6 DNA methylase [Roseivirga seohaensis]
MTNYFNELTKHLNTLGRRHDLARVFNDLLTLGICSFHSTNIKSLLQEKDEKNETLYFETIKPYAKDDLRELSKALGILQLNVYHEPYSDILGEFFMCHITRGQNGQYFTPEPVCELMAVINIEDAESDGKRVLDPACGSGRMLLRAAKINQRNYFFGADSSNTCAKMATLNFFLNGLKGEVAWMNSLSMEWFGGWQINQSGLGILPIEKEQSRIWSEAPMQKPKPETPEFDKTPQKQPN